MCSSFNLRSVCALCLLIVHRSLAFTKFRSGWAHRIRRVRIPFAHRSSEKVKRIRNDIPWQTFDFLAPSPRDPDLKKKKKITWTYTTCGSFHWRFNFTSQMTFVARFRPPLDITWPFMTLQCTYSARFCTTTNLSTNETIALYWRYESLCWNHLIRLMGKQCVYLYKLESQSKTGHIWRKTVLRLENTQLRGDKIFFQRYISVRQTNDSIRWRDNGPL